jgi:3-methylcrotonyl-CoA carboxylase alpha subunit
VSADLDTGLIEREREFLFPEQEAVPNEIFALATLAELLRESEQAIAGAYAHEDPYSPWHRRDGWRLNSGFTRNVKLRSGDDEQTIRVTYAPGGRHYLVDVDGLPVETRGQLSANGALRAELGGRRLSATVIVAAEKRHVFVDGRSYLLSAVDPLYVPGDGAGPDNRLTAPMPGKIVALLAEPGTVEEGTPLLIMEAMKMEHTIRAPSAGTLKAFRHAVGDQVSEGTELVDFEPATAAREVVVESESV